MRAVIGSGRDKGKVLDVRPGMAVAGHQFSEITLTWDDMKDERFLDWFRETVMCRMVPLDRSKT